MYMIIDINIYIYTLVRYIVSIVISEGVRPIIMTTYFAEIVLNKRFGVYKYTDEFREYYKNKTGMTMCYYCEDSRSDVTTIKLLKEFGLEKAASANTKFVIEQIPSQFSNYIEIEQYDGKETLIIDYCMYLCDKFKNINPSSPNLKDEVCLLQKELEEIEHKYT